MSGGGDYKIYNGEKETDKIIKTKLFVIEINDSLYINCRGLKYKKRPIGAWFAPALIRQGNVYFSAIPTSSDAAIAFGAIGVAIESSNATSSRVYYEINPADYKKLKKVDTERMKKILKDYPESLAQYEKELFKEHIEIVGKYLQQIKDF